MSRHPVTARIDDAIDHLEKLGQRVTPAAVKINVRKHLTYGDLSTHEMLDAAIDQRLRPRLAARGYVIADDETRVRKLFADCAPEEFAAQVEVAQINLDKCARRLSEDRKVLAFLRSKEQALGRPVTAGEFADEIAVLLAEATEAA